MYHVFYQVIETQVGMRNVVVTRAADECFHCSFKFSQTFTSVSITQNTDMFSFTKYSDAKKKRKSFTLTTIIKM